MVTFNVWKRSKKSEKMVGVEGPDSPPQDILLSWEYQAKYREQITLMIKQRTVFFLNYSKTLIWSKWSLNFRKWILSPSELFTWRHTGVWLLGFWGKITVPLGGYIWSPRMFLQRLRRQSSSVYILEYFWPQRKTPNFKLQI